MPSVFRNTLLCPLFLAARSHPILQRSLSASSNSCLFLALDLTALLALKFENVCMLDSNLGAIEPGAPQRYPGVMWLLNGRKWAFLIVRNGIFFFYKITLQGSEGGRSGRCCQSILQESCIFYFFTELGTLRRTMW